MSKQKDFSQVPTDDIQNFLNVDRDIWRVEAIKTKKVYKKSTTKIISTVSRIRNMVPFSSPSS